MKIAYKKMSGAGNDFVVVDNRDHKIADLVGMTRKACDRTNTLGGADGFIAIEDSGKAEFEMKYFNADGSTGAMCGNGGRCAARFALISGIVPSEHMLFEAVGSTYAADVTGERVRLAMPDPRTIRLNTTLNVRGQKIICHYVNVETPHAVIFIKDIITPKLQSVDELDINGWGKDVRMHADFAPEGANANFAELLNDGKVKLRTFERGVEGETLACGTGSVATAIAAHLLYSIPAPVRILTKSGEILAVNFKDTNGAISSLSLEGSANILSEGFLEIPGVHVKESFYDAAIHESGHIVFSYFYGFTVEFSELNTGIIGDGLTKIKYGEETPFANIVLQNLIDVFNGMNFDQQRHVAMIAIHLYIIAYAGGCCEAFFNHKPEEKHYNPEVSGFDLDIIKRIEQFMARTNGNDKNDSIIKNIFHVLETYPFLKNTIGSLTTKFLQSPTYKLTQKEIEETLNTNNFDTELDKIIAQKQV